MINSRVLRLILDPLRELAFPMDRIAKSLVFFLVCCLFGPHVGQVTEKISVIDECFVHDNKRLRPLRKRRNT